MAKLSEITAESADIHDLAVAVGQLSEEAHILRQSLDELRDDVVWAARQVLNAGYEVTGTQPPTPIDPLAPDAPPGRISEPEQDEAGDYCCSRPQLAWNGDPDCPGVACENCGYVIAEQGSVIIWREDDGDDESAVAETAAQARQGALFE